MDRRCLVLSKGLSSVHAALSRAVAVLTTLAVMDGEASDDGEVVCGCVGRMVQ